MTGNPPYLIQLMIRLAGGVEHLPEPVRLRHAQFFKQLQKADGGFGGRQGPSDPYYTSFAMRALALLGELDNETAERTAVFLRSIPLDGASVVDVISAVISVAVLDAAAGIQAIDPVQPWHDAVAARLHQLRRADGGFAKGQTGAAGSVYQTFLALICYQLMGHPLSEPQAIVEFVRARETPIGGFLEIRVAKRPGTNPTAAAIGTLKILDAMDQDVVARTRRFLGEMQNEEGGFLANSRIPLADLLSTFTGLLTLADLDGLDAIDTAAARRFVAARAHADGGFLAAAWDTVSDVEYSFYGLGCQTLLAPF